MLYTHPTLISESRRVTEFNWEKCIASPYNNCFSLALNGSKVPNYNVRVMKVSDAAYLRHHLVNYLQAFHEDPFLIIRIGILCVVFVVLMVGISRYSCTETYAEGNGNFPNYFYTIKL